MRRHLIGLVVLFCAVVGNQSDALAAKRLALLVGINDYPNLPEGQQLRRAVNDAEALGAALKEAGFEVQLAANPAQRDLVRTLLDFAARIEPGDEAVFFFAGHGVEIQGRNFLLPADVPNATPDEEELIKSEAIGLDRVLDIIRGRQARVSILVLDACRNNPFQSKGARSLGGSRGLALVRPPEGTFILFSAGVGQIAWDTLPGEGQDRSGEGANSVFTRTLIPMVKEPGIKLTDLARELRRRVLKLTAATPAPQRPAFYDEVVGDFFFTGPEAETGPIASGRTPAPGGDAAAAAWAAIETSKNPTELKLFIEDYPDSFFAKLARVRLKALTETEVAIGVFPDPRDTASEGRKVGDIFRDCEDCPEMVVVAAGAFELGSPLTEPERSSGEGPPLRVRITRSLAVGKFEITFDEWEACALDGGCDNYRPKDSGWGRGRRPAIYVSWQDASRYVAWLARKTGRRYRLLSEAEWEYVAKAGTSTPFSQGRTLTTAQANFDGNSAYAGGEKGLYRGRTVPVGEFGPNPFGVHDLHGNVAEWVQDCWNASHAGAASDASTRGGDCARRVVKGGAWYYEPGLARSAARLSFPEGKRLNVVGIRVARPLD